MRLETSFTMRPEQRQLIIPRMIQSMEILQLPLMALQERIDQELTENPWLEDLRDPASEVDSVSGDNGVDDSRAESATAEDSAETSSSEIEGDSIGEGDEFEALDFEKADFDWEESSQRASRAALQEEADRKQEAMQNMASRPPSLQEHLNAQIGFLELDAETRLAAEYIIHNLDDHGFFNLDLHEVVRDQGVTPQTAREALEAVQSLDPPGIGARNLKECLLLQLDHDTPHLEIIQTLINSHLEDIQQNRLPAIERKTGFKLEDIKESIEQLRRLNPRPGAAFSFEETSFVTPDLIVERNEDGEYEVRLEDENIPRLAISRTYQLMLKNKQSDSQTREFLQKKLQSARWLIDSIEQRRSTLLKVARAIIKHQRAFLDKGPEFIVPLKMQQIADEIEVHVTTVSRAVDDKWVLTPRGLFPLKRFFGGGTKTADGEDVAYETIKQKLLEVIAKEEKANPLSDDDLVKELEKQGLPIARRTVTKYRQMLNIPSSRQRKQF